MKTNILTLIIILTMYGPLGLGGLTQVQALWCVARSDATDAVLQSGLDYACAAGADCAPLLQTGLCFLPNTLQAHASYAYNSLFQRNNGATGSCDFSGSATLAKTDPSYGSCVYPSSPSAAGNIPSTTTTGTTPTTTTTTSPPYATSPPTGISSPFSPPTTTSGTFGSGSSTFSPTNMGPPIATTSDSTTTRPISIAATTLLTLLFSFIAIF